MSTLRRTIAAAELLLISPAVLFMAALLVRKLQPLQYEPARTAQLIVMWYAARQWTLWLLLLTLPFSVLVTGCATLRNLNGDVGLPHSPWQTHPTTLLVAAATVTAGCVLVLVVLHMLAN